MTDAKTTNPTGEMDAIIAALQRAKEMLGERIDFLAQAIAELGQTRQATVTADAARLLPAISRGVLNSLREQVPEFVSVTVEQAFASHRKFLGLFANRGYDQVLVLLQTRLACHLDQLKYGKCQQLDAVIVRSTTERTALEIKHSGTLELLQLLQTAQRQNVPLPSSVFAQIALIAKAARALESRRLPTATASRNSEIEADDDARESDTGPRLFFLSDIPTSTTAQLMDVPVDYPDNAGNRTPAAPADCPPARATEDAAATDDRLGCFS